MSLTICGDCQTPVSQKAKACPKCGKPFDSHLSKGAFFYLAVVFLGVFTFFYLAPPIGLIIIVIGALGFIVTTILKFFS